MDTLGTQRTATTDASTQLHALLPICPRTRQATRDSRIPVRLKNLLQRAELQLAETWEARSRRPGSS